MTNSNQNSGVFTVDTTGLVTFDYLFDGGWFQGELAIFSLEGMENYTPGSTEYIQEAARRALTNSQDGHVVLSDAQEGAKYSASTSWEGNFNQGEYQGVKTYNLAAGSQFAFMLVQHTTVQELADNPENYDQWGKLPLFSVPGLNPDLNGTDGVEQFAKIDDNGTFGFEATRVDQTSDQDYNEVVFRVSGATADAPEYDEVSNPGLNFNFAEIEAQHNAPDSELNLNTGIFTVDNSGQITFDYLFDGGWFQGEMAIFNLDGMENYTPGSTEYIQEAARRALTNSQEGHLVLNDAREGAKFSGGTPWEGDFNKGDYQGIKTYEMEAGSQFAFMLVQHTSVLELADNPERYNQWGKLPLFSIPGLNPDLKGADGVNQLAKLDQNGTFGFEATRVDKDSDRDYNEVVFQVTGATADVPYYGELRNAGRNFNFSEIGKQLREYSEDTVTEEGYLTVNQSGKVNVDVLFDGGWFKGEVGIFSLEGMEDMNTRSAEFMQTAAQRAISNSEDGYVLFADQTEAARFDGPTSWENNFNQGSYQGDQTYNLKGGSKYGLILMPNGTLQETANNPSFDGSRGKRPFFSLTSGNLLNAAQAVQLSEGTANKTVIAFEDKHIAYGSDRDYNDIVVSFEGVSFHGPDYEDNQVEEYNIEFAPIAENDLDITYKDTSIALKTDVLLSNDYDIDGDAIQFQDLDASNTQGLVSVINDRVLYDPNGQFDYLGAGESATDTFTYTIQDSNGNTATASVDITIKGFSEEGHENNVGTLDSYHLLPPLYAKQDVRDHYLVLSTTEETPFEVTLQNAAGAAGLEGGLNVTYTISKEHPLTLDLSNDLGDGTGTASLGILDESQVGSVNAYEGLVLQADYAFYANVRHQTRVQGLSLSSKGQLGLGTEFRSGHLVTNTNQDWRKAHFISVMASEDNTVVSFKDLPEGAKFVNGHPGQVVLNQYESFVVGLNIKDNHSLANELQGSLVVSDKPIAVNSGSWLSGTVGNGRDIGVDQLVPTNLVGNKYVLVKGESTSNANLLERPIVIATEDNTEVFLRGESTPLATLNAGESTILDGDEFNGADSLLIETSKGAYVYQMTSANNNTAPGLNLALPIVDTAGNQEIFIPNIDQLGPGKLNIVAQVGSVVNVNGTALTDGVAVQGDSSLVVHQVENLAGDVTVTSDEAISVTSTTGGGHIGAASHWSGLPTTFAFDDIVSTTADTAINIDILSNDLTSSGFQPVGFPEYASNGSVDINDDNTITYTPDSGFEGTDVFVYRGINDQGKTDTALVTVNVNLVDLEGSTGDDLLIGTSVSDRIIGYAGNDVITTGGGNDVLVFNSLGEGFDTITDFDLGQDMIDLTAIFGSANPLANGISFIQSGTDVLAQNNGSDLMVLEDQNVAAMTNADIFVF